MSKPLAAPQRRSFRWFCYDFAVAAEVLPLWLLGVYSVGQDLLLHLLEELVVADSAAAFEAFDSTPGLLQ